MLNKAMDSFQIAKRDIKEQNKNQYLDKVGSNGAKDYLRASEIGSEDRKIVYSFFKHQIPLIPRTAKSLRIFENGDFVHNRYQGAWAEMGCLISLEERLTSKDDEYLAQFDFELNGHYDGLLDVSMLRAHAMGLVDVVSVKDEATGAWALQTVLVEGAEAQLQSTAGITMVADIKTMSPWGFKKILDNGDLSNISAYVDQIMFYMYMLNTPYGSIYIEAKDSQQVVEVQIVWSDMYQDVVYGFHPDIHGEQTANQFRILVGNERFFGGNNTEGIIPKAQRLHTIKEGLRKADAENDLETIAKLMPPRCSEDPSKFPCSWGKLAGKNSEFCEFYDHCWDKNTMGRAVRPFVKDECPEDAKWVFLDDTTEIIVDSRKVPAGITYDGFLGLVGAGVLDYTKFLLEGTEAPAPVVSIAQAVQTSHCASDGFVSPTGEIIMTPPAPSSQPDNTNGETVEYTSEDGKRAIDCINCGKQTTFQKVVGGVKACVHCKHINKVVKGNMEPLA